MESGPDGEVGPPEQRRVPLVFLAFRARVFPVFLDAPEIYRISPAFRLFPVALTFQIFPIFPIFLIFLIFHAREPEQQPYHLRAAV